LPMASGQGPKSRDLFANSFQRKDARTSCRSR